MNIPKVSICIPTYNRAELLMIAVQSALNQTYQNIEILVVDDASTDDSVQTLKRLKDKRIRVLVNGDNLGMVGNWNRCLKLARGEYIKFLNSDDVLKPECVERLIMAALKYRVGFVGCNSEVIRRGENYLKNDLTPSGLSLRVEDLPSPRNESGAGSKRRGDKNQNGFQVVRLFEITKNSQRYSGDDLIRTFIASRVNNIGEPSSVLFERSLIKKAGRFNPHYKQIVDVEYWLRLLKYTDAYLIAEPLCQFLVHPEAHSSRGAREGWPIDDAFLLINEYGKLYGFDKSAYRFEIAASVHREIKQAVLRGDWQRAYRLERRLLNNVSLSTNISFLLRHLLSKFNS